jgi:segregation and condensation protein B
VTTPAFLEHFGLASLDDLPGLDELKAAGLLEARATVTTLAMRQDEIEEPDLPFEQVPAMAAE